MRTHSRFLGCCVIAGATLAACSRQTTTSPTPGVAAPGVATQTLPAISYEAHVPAGGIAPTGGTLTNPYAKDANAASNGAALFAAMNCDGCHGGGGSGWVGPSLADGRWRYGGADEEVFNSIYFGRPKGMPAFGGALAQDAIWTLVSYLKSLPVPADIATESWNE